MSGDHGDDDDEKSRKQPDDAVGYGKPPKHSQFRPGQSGNEGGRPKKPLSLAQLAIRVGSKTRTVREGGVSRQASNLELLFDAQFVKGIKGDTAAFRALASIIKNEPEVAQRKLNLREHQEKLVEDLTPLEKGVIESLRQEIAEFLPCGSEQSLPDTEGYDLDATDEEDDEIHPPADSEDDDTP